jgi:leucine-rich repeat protein SHOC2
MEQAELAQIIENGRFTTTLRLNSKQITTLPDSIGKLTDLTELDLSNNQLTTLPDTIGNLTKLKYIFLDNNQLNHLPDTLGNLKKLQHITLDNNQLTILPDSISTLANLTGLALNNNQLTYLPERVDNLCNLRWLEISGNPWMDLTPVARICAKNNFPNLFRCTFSSRYWINTSNWKSKWLLDERNATVRETIIAQIGYDKIVDELNAVSIDTWREYTLLRISFLGEEMFGYYLYDTAAAEAEGPVHELITIVLLKMNCPSTGHIHILRVPPEVTSAEAAITWVNHGIHPDKFAVQT